MHLFVTLTFRRHNAASVSSDVCGGEDHRHTGIGLGQPLASIPESTDQMQVSLAPPPKHPGVILPPALWEDGGGGGYSLG